MRPKLGKTPFGYKPHTEGSKELEEIPEELEALDKMQVLLSSKSISLRDGAAWIAYKTGSTISHQGLKNVIRERYNNSKGVNT